MSSLTHGAAIEKVTRAKTRVEEVLKFRKEVEAEVFELERRQLALKKKISGHINDKKNLSGFLVHPAERYHCCMSEIDHIALQALLSEDLKHWESIANGTVKS